MEKVFGFDLVGYGHAECDAVLGFIFTGFYAYFGVILGWWLGASDVL